LIPKQLIKLFSLILLITFVPKFIKAQDTIIKKKDSLAVSLDTLKKKKNSNYALSAKVVYSATDSIIFNIDQEKAYLFGNAKIEYDDITLTAAYIEISFTENLLFARGATDSTGKERGTPEFTQGAESFRAKSMTYNFKTQKGVIKQVITKEGENYLHGETVKRLANKQINVKSGMYTTCSLDHPHYEIKFSKAKVIPNEKIVTGPAYLVIEDVPTPLALPFGYFPNKKGQKSGILIPTYGESSNRGFYLENGGYYMGMGEHFDLALRGTIYSRGSWAAKVASNYKKRYKYSGELNLEYAVNIIGEKELPGYEKRNDFFIRWNHTQDSKARPNSRFSAFVNAGSSKFNAYNPVSAGDYLTNQYSSNISYTTTINQKYNFSANMRHTQNTIDKTLSMSLPEVTFSVNRFYPFRPKDRVGAAKWYDNIYVSYTMNSRNTLSTIDSLLFEHSTLRKFQNGMDHTIPISSTIKVLKYFSLTNSINYNERWYLQSIHKGWTLDSIVNGIYYGGVKTDTVNGFKAARDFNFSASLNTKLYGMLQFKHGYIRAFRHVLTPSVSFVYTPDFGSQAWGYYKYYADTTFHGDPKQLKKYSIFEEGIYGTPPSAESGNINFAFANNLEMKVRSKKDTVSGFKKLTLIENLNISASYDVAKDSCNWSDLLMSGYTKLFRNLDLRYAAAWTPYMTDTLGRNLSSFLYDKSKKFLKLRNNDLAVGLNWSFSSKNLKKKKTTDKGTPEELAMINNNLDGYVDFDVPWSFNFAYTFRYTKNFLVKELPGQKDIIQTLSFNGDVNITSKWKIGFTSGYDFEQKDFSYTSINIYRDLHCWEMKFNWIPTGFRKSYNLTINVKSQMLQDLKLTKKKDWRDY
jgi:lipopolysaccharide assembly outer membrane protein LptD (OstA)